MKPESIAEKFAVFGDNDADSDDGAIPSSPAPHACNVDLAPWPGCLTHDGTLLPVSLPGLRELGREFEMKLGIANGEAAAVNPPLLDGLDDEEEDDDDIAPMKREPMELEDDLGDVKPGAGSAVPPPHAFPKGSVAYDLLSSGGDISLLQLPGLLALAENPAMAVLADNSEGKEEFSESSVAAAAAAAERMRGLGTDLRNVGNPGEVCKLGKLRFYKSGKVEMVLRKGGVLEVEKGVESDKCQQLVLVDTEGKTCEEIQGSVSKRLVALPAVEGF